MHEEKPQSDDRQIVKQIDDALSTVAKLFDQLTALKRHVEKRNPVRDILTFYDEQWIALYHPGAKPPVRYTFNRTVDPSHVKRLLKVMDETTLKSRVARYFADREPFLMKQKHPFNFFISRINTYAGQSTTAPGAATTAPSQAPADCKHEPRCIDDLAHTQRRQEDMRRVE